MKKAVIVGILILALGLVVSGISFALMGFSFNSFAKEKYESVTTEIGTEFTAIDIRGNTENIRLCRIDQNFPEIRTPRVVCSENSWLKHTVTVENDTLTIRSVDTRKWYDHIGVNVSGKPEIVLYVPAKPYDLKVETDTGDVELRGRSAYGGIDIRTDTGDVRCEAETNGSVSIQTATGDIVWEDPEDPGPLLIAGDMALSVSTGHIRITNLNCDGKASVHVSTGKTEMERFTCVSLESTGSTGRITLTEVIAGDSISIQRSTGDVTFERCDAPDIRVKTDTGDVTGTLLTGKEFLTETDTGKVDVPRYAPGGTCEIKTDTGDIKISVDESMT